MGRMQLFLTPAPASEPDPTCNRSLSLGPEPHGGAQIEPRPFLGHRDLSLLGWASVTSLP